MSIDFEIRRGKIIREYRIFDEISVIAQIIKGDKGWEAPAGQGAASPLR